MYMYKYIRILGVLFKEDALFSLKELGNVELHTREIMNAINL